jgi:hypothetical protein
MGKRQNFPSLETRTAKKFLWKLTVQWLFSLTAVVASWVVPKRTLSQNLNDGEIQFASGARKFPAIWSPRAREQHGQPA